MFLGDTMVLYESLLGPAPESLQAINIHLPGREVFLMVNVQMSVSAEYQAVIAFELIRVYDRSPADLLDRHTQQGLSCYIWNYGNLNDAVSLQNPEDGNLPGSTTTPFTLASAAEVALIQLDLPVQQSFGISGMAQDRQADGANSSINGPVRQPHLLGHLPDRNFQLKELDQGKPLYTGQSSLVDPSP